MGRRLKRGFVRLALFAGIPFLSLWALFEVLALQSQQAARATLGASASQAEVAKMAHWLATARMNGWADAVPGFVAILLLALIWGAIELAFHIPGPRVDRLRTRRLILRRLCADDVEALHAIFSDPDTVKYWDFPPHQSLAETASWVEEAMAVSLDEADDFVIERKGQAIGIMGARRWPWLTFLIAREHWGQGYGGEALAAFVGYAFDRGLGILLVATDTRNAASMAMLRRRGFAEYRRDPITHAARNETVEAAGFRLDAPKWMWRPWFRLSNPKEAIE